MNAIWEVDLFANGPISVIGRINLNEPKGLNFEDPFYSSIQIQKRGNAGVTAFITAKASTRSLARKAALHFFSQTIDVLALYTNLPIELSIYDDANRPNRFNERRIVGADEWKWSFREARTLTYPESTFLRAIGWYRKGLIAEDPFDKFLAFWNAIEIVASKYHPRTERAQNGTKSQIWECFKKIWSVDCDEWPIIPGDKNWIDVHYEIRTNIAHGIMPVNVESVAIVTEKLNILAKVSRSFLLDWRRNELKVEIPPAVADLYRIDLPEIATDY